MHFRHISAKIQSKNLKRHFNWGGESGLLGLPLAMSLPQLVPTLLRHCLQNLVQYFKLPYVFSVRFKSFVIVLT